MAKKAKTKAQTKAQTEPKTPLAAVPKMPPEPPPQAQYAHRSAITGRWVRFTTWLRHPRTTTRERVK